MSYLIAVATTDGKIIDEGFREAESFYIIKVTGVKSYKLQEIRSFRTENENVLKVQCEQNTLNAHCCNKGGSAGCNCNSPKVVMLEDCRAILCTKMGLKMRKSFEKKAISIFELNIQTDEALDRITEYYERLDNHQSLRDFTRSV